MSIYRKPERPYTRHNCVEIVRGGADFFRTMVDMISTARYAVHLQTYIFDGDETGMQVAQALMAAADRGVFVYVIADGYASQDLPDKLIAEMRGHGVRFRYFEPFFLGRNYYFGRRMHHKVLVADGRFCLVGGVNISNRYNDLPGQAAWLDWALKVEGDAALRLDRLCVRIWNRSLFSEKCHAVQAPEYVPPTDECPVRISRNDWVYKRTEITSTYRRLFSQAEREVVVMTSYFWPPQGLLRRLIAATRRGVAVKLVLTGYADVPLSKYAERYLYHRLLRNGVEIYEYQPNVLHGKVAVCDGVFMTVGSYNLNNISAFASVELNLDVLDDAKASELRTDLLGVIGRDCRRVTIADFNASSKAWKRLGYYFSYRVVQLIFFLFTFYFTQHEQRN